MLKLKYLATALLVSALVPATAEAARKKPICERQERLVCPLFLPRERCVCRSYDRDVSTPRAGAVQTGDVPNRPDRPDRPDQPDKPDNPGKPDKPDKPGKPDKPDKPDRPDKPKPGKPGKGNRGHGNDDDRFDSHNPGKKHGRDNDSSDPDSPGRGPKKD